MTGTEAESKAAHNVPIERQIAAVERELTYRRSVYPRLVAAGKLTESAAAQQTWEMLAVLGTLRRLDGGPRQRSLLEG